MSYFTLQALWRYPDPDGNISSPGKQEMSNIFDNPIITAVIHTEIHQEWKKIPGNKETQIQILVVE